MNIIRKFILWVTQKIQTMIVRRAYNERKEISNEALKQFIEYFVPQNDLFDMHGFESASLLYRYFKEDVPTVDGHSKIKFIVGNYSFYMDFVINMQIGEGLVDIYTYETITDRRRLDEHEIEKVKQVERLNISITQREHDRLEHRVTIKGGTSNGLRSLIDVYAEYCKRLVEYIDEQEKAAQEKAA